MKILVFAKTASGFSAFSLPRFLTKKTRALLVLFSREKKYGKIKNQNEANSRTFDANLTFANCLSRAFCEKARALLALFLCKKSARKTFIKKQKFPLTNGK